MASPVTDDEDDDDDDEEEEDEDDEDDDDGADAALLTTMVLFRFSWTHSKLQYASSSSEQKRNDACSFSIAASGKCISHGCVSRNVEMSILRRR